MPAPSSRVAQASRKPQQQPTRRERPDGHLRLHLDVARTWHREPAQIVGYPRSEEHTSELQSLMRISYAVFCLKKKTFSSLILLSPFLQLLPSSLSISSLFLLSHL